MKCIEDEIPFELPEGWAWARLGTVCSKVTDGTHHSPNNYPIGEYKYVTAKNIKLNGIILEDITYVTAEVHKEIFSRCNPEFGDILYIKDGATSGIATINTLHEEFSMLSSVALLKPAYGIDNWYMCYAMQSPYFYTITRGNMKGVGITRITLNMLVSRLIPVPPLQEQKQISVKCRELISLSSNIENDKEFIRQILSETKSKILDLAIRGKLVPQDPNDEPASVLLERIRTEKEELIKQGKIKRNKKESVIFKGSDNSYYEKYGEKLPSGWVATNFETLLSYEQPTNYIVKDTNYNSEYETPVLTAGKSFILGYTNEKENIFSELPVIIFDDFTTESKFVNFPFKVKSSAMKILHINTDLVLPKFAFYLMQATQIDHDNHQRYWISTYSQEEIALPPLKEQERILSALEQYFKLLNCLL